MHPRDFLHQNAPHLPHRSRPFVDAVQHPDAAALTDAVHVLYEQARAGHFQPPGGEVVPVESAADLRLNLDDGRFSVLEEAERRVRERIAARSATVPAPRATRSGRRFPWRTFGGRRTATSLLIATPLIDGALIALTDLDPLGVVATSLAAAALIIGARHLDRHFHLRLGPRLRATTRFAFTTATIFGVLFLGLNASSYWERAQYFFRGSSSSAESQKGQLLAGLLPDERRPQQPTVGDTPQDDPGQTPTPPSEADVNLQANLAQRQEQLSFRGFAVSPPDDRLIIPRLGKNVPIVQTPDTALLTQDWEGLERQIQSDLQRGVVHYPGTAQPGEKGNVFLTGHSSYYPWDPGRYKSVFAVLDQLVVGDQVIVYSRGEKFVYTISSIRVVTPERTDVLSQPKDDSILTLMTCTPIGTALNRLIITADQVSPDPALNRAPTVNDGSRISSLQA